MAQGMFAASGSAYCKVAIQTYSELTARRISRKGPLLAFTRIGLHASVKCGH